MIAPLIEQRTNSTIPYIVERDETPAYIDTDYADLGDILYNIETKQEARLEAVTDDPFDFWSDEPATVGYVIGWNDEMQSNFSDYWHPGDCVVIKRG